MSDYLDNFTGTNGEGLIGRTSDSGHKYAGDAGFEVQTNRLSSTASGTEIVTTIYENDGVTPYQTDGSFDVDVDVFNISGNADIGILLCVVDADNLYLFDVRNNDIRLFLKSAGTFTSLGTAPVPSQNFTMTAEVRSAGITVKSGGSTLITSDDTTHPRAGGAAYRSVNGISAAYDFDSVAITNLSTPTITDINNINEVTPLTTATLTGTNLTNTSGITINGWPQAEVTVVSDTEVTFLVERGNNPYNQDLTAELTSTDGTATITVQQLPETGTFSVTAASPNTTDDASLWTGLVDTVTGDPITIVDGDQAWVENPNNLGNLAIDPDGTITADDTGTFQVQIWLASEGEWGGDQTVSFTLPDAALLPKGTMPILRFLADQGITKGTINERLIKFFQSQGATSRQFNHAQKQYEDTL